MAVAAYASLVSLTHVLDNIQYRMWLHRFYMDRKQIDTLQENVRFLLDFVEAHSQKKSRGIQGLWRQITEMSFEAEEIFDLDVVGYQDPENDVGRPPFRQAMDRLIQSIISIRKEALEVKEEQIGRQYETQPRVSVPAISSSPSFSSKSIMVGFDEHRVRIMDELTRDERNLRTIPIVGMGGIGKTTLARHVFDDPYIIHYFDLCIWLTISQKYSVKQILLGLLNEVSKEVDRGLPELGEKIHKKLFYRRYLIVMDDVWTTNVWDDLKMFFPDNRNGSRIIITTRLSSVAISFGCQNPYLIDFLNEDDNWNLLCQKVFSQEGCPFLEFERVGKSIAKSCRGLPLAIVVIGSQLAKSTMTQEYWEFVAKHVNSFGNLGADEHCLRLLSLSYHNLSICLKSYFIYMKVFPEDHGINVSEQIRLWIAEGFIKSISDRILEEIAEEYFKDLVDRNLIFIRKRGIGGDIEICGVHDLVRDLCLREFDKECFTSSPRVQHMQRKFDPQVCFLCSDTSIEKEPINDIHGLAFLNSPPTSQVSLFLCHACKKMNLRMAGRRLLWVMDVVSYGFHRRPVQPTTLRYASIRSFDHLKFPSPSVLHLLSNLQTLKIFVHSWSKPLVLPSQIWEMPQLRHINVTPAILLDPEPTLPMP